MRKILFASLLLISGSIFGMEKSLKKAKNKRSKKFKKEKTEKDNPGPKARLGARAAKHIPGAKKKYAKRLVKKGEKILVELVPDALAGLTCLTSAFFLWRSRERFASVSQLGVLCLLVKRAMPKIKKLMQIDADLKKMYPDLNYGSK